MKIYTKTGDSGKTGLGGGGRRSKNDVRIAAYGELDECNAALGLCLSMAVAEETTEILLQIQNKLFALGAHLANPGLIEKPKDPKTDIATSDITTLEQAIDQLEERLEPLKHFILPGGCKSAASLHLARTIARRAERRMVQLHETEPLPGTFLIYINRLSDLLFVMARFENQSAGVQEQIW